MDAERLRDLTTHVSLPLYVGSALLGVSSHQIFRMKEPTINGFVGHVLCVLGAMAVWCRLTGTFVAILPAFAIYVSSLSTSLLAYRVLFHPLNGYPGPLKCKITRFVATSHVMNRDSHTWLTGLHKQYGDVVRISPNELSYISTSSPDSIHGAKAGKLARGQFYSGDPNRPANSMLSTGDLAEHRWRRKGWERGFGSLQLKQFEPRVAKHLDTLTAELSKLTGEVIDMTKWCEFFAYDVMSDLAFSEDFGMLAGGKPHRYVSALHGATRLLVVAAQTPWIRPIVQYLPVEKQSKIDGKDFAQISKKTYDRRRERKVTEPDMFEYISRKADLPRPLTEPEFIADAGLLIAAGAVSTALSLTFVFRYVCEDRLRMEKLQAEIDACWDGTSPLDVGTLGPKAAPYLDGCINESLRLWPPAPTGMQRVTPVEGAVIDDRMVPGKTQLSVHTMGIQRDARHFTDPDAFVPERWDDNERPANYSHDTRAFIPFTIGQYACLGKNLAYQEMRLFVARAMRKFDFKFPDGFDPAEFDAGVKFKGTFLIKPLPVVCAARQQ